MAQVTLKVEVPKIPLLRRGAAQDVLKQEHKLFIASALERYASIGREVTPVGVSALLRGTIVTNILVGQRADVVGQVIWQQPYAKFVDEGTPPHFPPIGPLLRWAERVLGDRRAAYAVQIAISRRGTAVQNFSQQTRDRAAPEIRMLYQRAIQRFARRLGAPG